ncbi:late control protein D [Lactobacillus sp. PV034]|uniref:XkdQ/YqbQ family protein n=1 Tax=Lactobacillus sp. PV034 TaxID=2594495 RepID=UPI002240A5E8|nr:late control protein D [Lactobacillus sp. PV034]QNQ80777.1 late control protein D [Lactobacillus sp. PV034]
MITKFDISPRVPNGTPKYDVKDMVKNLKWVTDLNYSAGTLTFDLVQNDIPVLPAMGAVVDFAWDHKNVFYGFVFKTEFKADKTVSVTAYDYERYLKSEGSIVFQAGTVWDRFKQVCRFDNVPFNNVKYNEVPNYTVPAEVCDGKTGFDMIKSAINKTYTATGNMHFLYMNYNHLELGIAPRNNGGMRLVVDSRTVMTDFTFSESIDNTANLVYVVQKNDSSSQSKTATADASNISTGEDPKTTSFTIASSWDNNTVSKWGTLKKVENAKNKANYAQMVQQAKDKLKELNQSEKTLSVDCLGDLGLTVGSGIDVTISDLSMTWHNCPIIKATHNFSENDYTCSLDVKVGSKWQSLEGASMS